MPLGSAEIEQIGTYVRANLAEWMEDIVGPRLLGRTARVEDELIGLANRHPGVGGHCIAVDPWFIVHSAPERTPLMQAARQVNSGKPRWVAEQVLAAWQGTKVTILTHVSPTVFREGPYRFFFFSREEARIHVHVICASGEAKFWLDPAVEPAMSKGISAHESRAIQRIIERRKEEIVRAWRQHFAS